MLVSDRFYNDLGVPVLDARQDHVLLCGNEGLITDVRSILASSCFEEASHAKFGQFAVEKAFVLR